MLQTATEFGQLQAVDAALGNYRPFGNHEYIRKELHHCLLRRLTVIAANLPAAGSLLDALSSTDSATRDRVFSDTVVRCVIQQSLRVALTGEDEYGLPRSLRVAVLEATAAHVDNGHSSAPLEAGMPNVERLTADTRAPWFWAESHDDDVFGEAFRELILQNYGEQLCVPTQDELNTVRLAGQLLHDLLPAITHSALAHTYLIALFPRIGNWRGRASASQFRIGGTIFLSRDALRNPWWTAEHLLHESLHQKLYDFRHGHTLLRQDARPTEAVLTEEARQSVADRVTVLSPWNVPGQQDLNRWDTDRALAAFHVYVHLALLATAAQARRAELEDVYGPIDTRPPLMTGARAAFDRAHYLGENIMATCWEQLGDAGRHMVAWLTSVLDDLDAAPPPGASLHLLLHRYMIEATTVARRTLTPDLASELDDLATAESVAVQGILDALGHASCASKLAAATAEVNHDRRFVRTRQAVTDALRTASTDGYTLRDRQGVRSQEDDVRQTIENSSRRLADLGLVGGAGRVSHVNGRQADQ